MTTFMLLLVNMFTINSKPRSRGRPRGQTAQGAAARERLYRIAVQLMAKRGFESTTLRDVAAEAGVSVGLLYRYFPNKRAVIIALYDELSADFVAQASDMPRGRWRDRFVFALKASLKALDPHRVALKGLIPVLVGDPEEGVFSESTAFSRLKVQRVFEEAVVGSSDAPGGALARAMGRLLYMVHLGVPLVAAGQEREATSDRRPRLAHAASAAVSRCRTAASARSALRALDGHAG